MNDLEVALDHYVNLAIDDGLSMPKTLEARKQLLQSVKQGFPTPYISALSGIKDAYPIPPISPPIEDQQPK